MGSGTGAQTRGASRKLAFWTAVVLMAGACGANAGGPHRRLLDQNCPATYPVSFAGTCFLCPEGYPFFYLRKCYVSQTSANAAGASDPNNTPATSQPITDPPTSEQAVTSTVPATQDMVPSGAGGSVVTYSCGDASQVLWNNNCYSCPTDHPFFSAGSCYNVNPTVSATNPNSASAAAARQGSGTFGQTGAISGGGRRLLTS